MCRSLPLAAWLGVMTMMALRTAAASPAAPAPPAAAPAPSSPAEGGELAELERALSADRAAAPRQEQAEREGDPGPVTRGLARVLQTLNPDLSFIADVALAYFTAEEPLVAGGHDPSQSGFTLQQLELAASAMVDPYFRFDANIVFSQVGVEIEEVYATTLALPLNLQVRAGQFLTRFGRCNATHPHAWAFVDQNLIIGKFFGGEGNRGLGVEASVLLPLPWYVEILASGTDAAGEGTARSFFGAEDLGVEGPLDFQYTAAIKQFFPLADDWSLAWGLSLAAGPNSTGRDNRTEIYGTDLYLKYRPITHGSYTVVSLDAEWMLRRRQVPDGVLQDHGLYASLFWRLARRWGVAARYEYVAGLGDDPLDEDWTDLRQRVSANVTFWPTEFSRLRAQYAYDLPGWLVGSHAAVLALEISVGAHGAHAF